MTAESDADLLRRSRTDASAFRAFYDRWSGPVLGFFQRRVGEPQVALDLTAETFAIVFEKSGQFRYRGRSPAAWVFAIARRELQRFFRDQAVHRRAVQRLGVATPVFADSDLQRVEELIDTAALRELVAAALGTVREQDRRVLELRFVDRLPFTDIAQALGCSVGAARVRCHRALTRLENKLGELEQLEGALP